MAVEIPLRGDMPHYTFEVELEGAVYGFDFRWNERAEGWFVGMYNSRGEPLAVGKRLVVAFPLFARHKGPDFPPGMLIAVDTTGEDRDPGLNDLGSRVKLYYFDSTDE
jgi:hypothetical protein